MDIESLVSGKNWTYWNEICWKISINFSDQLKRALTSNKIEKKRTQIGKNHQVVQFSCGLEFFWLLLGKVQKWNQENQKCVKAQKCFLRKIETLNKSGGNFSSKISSNLSHLMKYSKIIQLYAENIFTRVDKVLVLPQNRSWYQRRDFFHWNSRKNKQKNQFSAHFQLDWIKKYLFFWEKI